MSQFLNEQEGETEAAPARRIFDESLNEETVILAMRELRTTLQRDINGVKADVAKLLEMQTIVMGKLVVLDAAVHGLGEVGSAPDCSIPRSQAKSAVRDESRSSSAYIQ